MNDRISKIIKTSADVLYSHGLSAFDAKAQQYLISNCALGKFSELYENKEMSELSKKAFLDAWFRGNITENGHITLLNCDCKNSDPSAKDYLIFIFYGIGMPEGDIKMKNFADSLKDVLIKRNPENTVNINHVAAYDDSNNNMGLNDVILADAVQVVLRAYMPYNSAIMRFCDLVEKACKNNKNSEPILIGYSGGGVVVSEMEKVLKKKDCVPKKIIRIGSPELKVPNEILDKTVNIIIPGDPVPLVTFMREKDRFKMNNHFLLDIKYDTVNPIEVHGLYFSDAEDDTGTKNYEKTARLVSQYIN